MIVLDDLNPIFGDYLVELRLREHITSFLDRVLSLSFKVDSWCTILAIVKVDANLALIFNLIDVDIRHLHLFDID